MKLGLLLFSSQGSISRKEFIKGFALAILLGALFVFLAYYKSAGEHFFAAQVYSKSLQGNSWVRYSTPGENLSFGLKLFITSFYLLGYLIWIYSFIALGIKRLRDMGLSPGWLSIIFLPMVVYFMFVPWDLEWTGRFFFIFPLSMNYIWVLLILLFYLFLIISLLTFSLTASKTTNNPTLRQKKFEGEWLIIGVLLIFALTILMKTFIPEKSSGTLPFSRHKINIS